MVGVRRILASLPVVATAVVLAMPADAQEPSDERQREQWAVAPGAVLNLPPAWEISQGAGVVVAIVDSGTRLEHPDLAPNVWTNFREVPRNGKDDDDNGYVDDVHGVDLTSGRSGQDLSDGNGHGTHVAGIVAAAANGRGVVGVAYRAKIMTVKVLDAQRRGKTAAVAEGIRYAAANGARIINLSLGGPQPDRQMTEAIREAGDAGVLVVCSAGNEGRDIDRKPSYPVSTKADNVLGVASTAPADGRSLGENSNFGHNTVGLAAPGVGVLSTANDGGYELKTGTSMAAPHVTGVAALVAALRPDMSAQELRAQLLQSASRAPGVRVGSGYLDALGAVLRVTSASTYRLGQPPKVHVLRAVSRRRQVQLQVAALGSRQAIARYRISAGRKRLTDVRAGRSPFTVRVRVKRRVGKIRVQALDARGGVLAADSRRVRAVRKGKRGVRRGGDVGGTG